MPNIARIIVTPKKSVLDPQGEAVRRAIHALGLEGVASTRVGKFIELELPGGIADAAKKKLDEISHELLSNPVVEDYRIEYADAPSAKPAPAPKAKAASTPVKKPAAKPARKK